MTIDYEALGERIKNARTGLHLTQEKLAEIAGLSPSHLSNIETGTTRVSLNTVVRLANALGVSVDHLLADSVLQARPVLEGEVQVVLEDCDEYEIRVIAQIIAATKDALRRERRFRAPGVRQTPEPKKGAS